MNKYKIESTYLEHPLFLETESADEAFEMFVAYCDYNNVEEDEIETEYKDGDIVYAVAYEQAQIDNDTDETESVAKFEFVKIEGGTICK